MADEQKEEPKQKAERSSPPVASTMEEMEAIINNKQDSHNQEKGRENIETKIHSAGSKPITTTTIKIKKKDVFNIAGLAIQAVLAIFTYLLFTKTIDSTQAAIDAVKEAKNANKTSRDNYILSKAQFDNSIASEKEEAKRRETVSRTDSINAAKRFKLDSISKDVQNESLKETQRQFVASNEPFLQMDGVTVDTPFQANKPIKIFSSIRNLKIFPVKIISLKGAFSIANKDNMYSNGFINSNEFEKYSLKSVSNIYITNETPFKTDGKIVLSEEEFKAYIDRKKFLYIIADITYKDLASSKERFYKSIIKINTVSPSPNNPNILITTYQFIFNENGYK